MTTSPAVGRARSLSTAIGRLTRELDVARRDRVKAWRQAIADGVELEVIASACDVTPSAVRMALMRAERHQEANQ